MFSGGNVNYLFFKLFTCVFHWDSFRRNLNKVLDFFFFFFLNFLQNQENQILYRFFFESNFFKNSKKNLL